MFSCKQTIPSESTSSQSQPELRALCRICLQEAPESRSIFDLDQSSQLSYSERVMQCADVEIYPNDSLPTKICLQCIEDLNVASRFRANCTSSNVVLQTYLSYNGLETHASDIQDQPCGQDDEEEIAIHLDSGVMYTFKPPNGLDVKLVRCSGEEGIGTVEEVPTEVTGRDKDGSVEGKASFGPAMTMAIASVPSSYSNSDGENIFSIESGQNSENDDFDYVIYSVNEPKVDESTLENDSDIPDAQPFAHVGQKQLKTVTSTMVTAESRDVHTHGNELSTPSATAMKNVKTLKTIRKTHTPNESKPTIEAVTTQPAEDGRGVETVIRVKRNITTSKPAFICKLCNATYKHKHALETHMRRHRGDRPYKCEYCEKSFVVPFELQRHQRTHTGQKPYKCQYCERAYSDFSSKTKHERIHTGERPYVCYYCGKTFSYSHVLKGHLLVHTGERNYCCTICGKRFSKAHHLKTHAKTHSPLMTEVGSNDAEIAVELSNNSIIKHETTDVVYTEMLQDELIASHDDDQQISVDGNGVLVGSYHGNGSSGLIATNAWTTLVNNNTDSANGNTATAAGIVPEELENVSIVSFTDYIIKSDGLDDLMVVQDSSAELVGLVGQSIMDR